MSLYFPFLKLKQNELQAISGLEPDVAATIHPLFDVPRTSKQLTEAMILDRLRLGERELGKAIKRHNNLRFFLDNYDLDDTILLNGRAQYAHILDSLAHYNPSPIVALNRVPTHNAAAISFTSERSRNVGLRLQQGDLESFALAERHLDKLWSDMSGKVDMVDLILDFRFLKPGIDAATPTKFFVKQCVAKYPINNIVCAGSIIPANISDLIKTNSNLEAVRTEVLTWEILRASPGLDHIAFGDYGVVSPDYSDAEIGQQLLRQVSTPKIFYPFDRSFFVSRGSSFESNPKGNNQFFDLADQIANKPYFRKVNYSEGDTYIHIRSAASSNKPLKAGTQGSWTKAMTSAHITFISRKLRGLP